MNRSDFNEELNAGLKELGIQHSPDIMDKFWLYMNFLIEENKKYNLTGITSPPEIITRHFLDSLAPLSFMDIDKQTNIIDIGTGAGFPGLTFKIINPELSIVLMDSVLKKINFLKLLTAKLDLTRGVEAIHGRAEVYGKKPDYRETFGCVVSRAVAPLNVLVEYTLPFVEINGKVLLYKGPDYKDELKKAERAVKLLGGEISSVREMKIPDLKAERFIILINKTAETPHKYPRRNGIPKKRPL